MLNSFWGKFGQRENLPQVQQCTNPDQLYKLLDDDTLEVQNNRFCSEDVIEVVFKNKEEDNDIPNAKTNIFILPPPGLFHPALYGLCERGAGQTSVGERGYFVAIQEVKQLILIQMIEVTFAMLMCK